jgi:hypothetical protein
MSIRPTSRENPAVHPEIGSALEPTSPTPSASTVFAEGILAKGVHAGAAPAARRPARLTTTALQLLVASATTAATAVAQQAPAPGPAAPWHTPALSHVPTPDWLSMSGELRVRMESRAGQGYQEGVEDGYGLVRTRFNVDVRPHALVRLSFQGQDARSPGMENPSGTFRDPFDIRQAYLRIGRAQDAPVALTVGRQLLSYADQRLIGPLDWTNTSRAFDAAKLEVRTARLDVDVFSSAVVVNDPEEAVNESDFDNSFHGVYTRVRPGVEQLTIEPFFLWRVIPDGASGAGDRYSIGGRAVGRFGRLESTAMFVEQWGEASGLDIHARALSATASYSMAATWSPRVYGEYNYASGDTDGTDGRVESFNDMYPTAHLYYGYNDLVGYRNIHNVRLGASVVPWRQLSVAVDFHTFDLATGNDNLYNSGGAATVLAPPGGAPDRSVGEELDLTLSSPIGETITVAGGVGRLFTGPFLEANSPGADQTFTYFALTMRF